MKVKDKIYALVPSTAVLCIGCAFEENSNGVLDCLELEKEGYEFKCGIATIYEEVQGVDAEQSSV